MLGRLMLELGSPLIIDKLNPGVCRLNKPCPKVNLSDSMWYQRMTHIPIGSFNTVYPHSYIISASSFDNSADLLADSSVQINWPPCKGERYTISGREHDSSTCAKSICPLFRTVLAAPDKAISYAEYTVNRISDEDGGQGTHFGST